MRLKLGASIIIAVVIGLLIPVSVTTLIVLDRREKDLERRLAADHQRLTEILALGMKEPLWTFNVEAARPLFESIFRDLRVVEATVRDRRLGAFLLLQYPERAKGRQRRLTQEVIYSNGLPIGTVDILMDTSTLDAEVAADRTLFALTFIGQLALAIFLVLALLQDRLIRPIKQLLRDSARLARRELGKPFVWKRDDEIGLLGSSLEETRQALQALFAELEEKNRELERDIRHRANMTMELQRQHDHLEDLVRVRTTELMDAKVRAELASQAKSVFLASMSHELRTPLNAILGYAQILRRDRNLTDRQAAGLDTVEQSGAHLLMLINDILDLSKIEAGKLELMSGVLHLPQFLRLIADIIRVKAEQKGLTFIYEEPPALPTAIRADEKRLRQVLLNLLGNAVRFSDRGQVTLRVKHEPAGEASERLRFEIEDTGIGIAEAQMDTLFRPFEQAGDLHRRLGGTGLGLAISRQLVRLMGSDIGVRSRPGVGSLFWFELTVPQAQAEVAAAPASVVIAGYEGRRRRALVVDDILGNRSMLRDFLGSLGFEIEEAANGVQALAAVHSRQPDLVLMDIVMPEMDGIEAIRRMRAQAGLREVPIIAVSASTSPSDEQNALDAGATAFFMKPLDFAALLERIGQVLGLVWIYERSAVPSPTASAPLIAPPYDELVILQHMARIGNMRDIRERALHVAALDERYRAFAERLRVLTETYQSRAILELVESYLRENA